MQHTIGHLGRMGATIRTALVLALIALAAVPAGAAATPVATTAFVPAPLLEAAQANPDAVFKVILQGNRGVTSTALGGLISLQRLETPGAAFGTKRRFATLNGASAEVTGRQLVRLAQRKEILAITRDTPVRASSLSTRQQWPHVAGVAKGWSQVTGGSLPQLPAIAVVDSGVEAGRADFGGRVVKQVEMTSLPGNSAGDGRGHGTFVAGIAAGSAPSYTGAAPSAPIVSIDVMNDAGMALTSDVIAAADWIYQNRATHRIRVANFSLHATAPASIFLDPLDRAVERLWFSGVVVVAASGNYGADGLPSGVRHAPGNDPFVLTVGANDIRGTISSNDDVAAPWSAYGYTYDGFAKPELAAPGRYLVGPVPAASTLAAERPTSVVSPGYMQLSGTSFSAAAVSGAAAYLLALNPHWTPDQVKGALMVSARATPSAAPLSNGVGELDLARAALVTNPPNPNAALNQFVVPDPAGGAVPVFDAASWGAAATLDPAWNAASWGAASWGAASWGAASWGSASWGAASWGAASWGAASWSAASWGTASWGAASWGAASWGAASWGAASWGAASWGADSVADNADGEFHPGGGYLLDDEQAAIVEAELASG